MKPLAYVSIMITNKNSQYSYRYTHNVHHTAKQLIPTLINQMQERRQTQELKSTNKIKQQRILHHSMSVSQSRRKESQSRPLFNNKTKEGQLIDEKNKFIPYIFVPKYKNETFIMPSRVFQKGKAGKRFYIKMKDSSIYSFKDEETSLLESTLKKPEKQQTILSRKVQEYNRIVDENDGKKRAAHNTWCLKTRKNFNYTNQGSQLFSISEPMNEVKDQEKTIIRKTHLAKTFDFSNKWQPNTQSNNLFNKTESKILTKHRSQLSEYIQFKS